MSDHDALFNAARAFLARGHAQLAARALALAHLEPDSAEGRTAHLTPASLPWPDHMAAAFLLLNGTPWTGPLDGGALASALRESEAGAAYLTAWGEAGGAEWGEGHVVLSPAARMLLASLDEGDDD